MPSVDRLDAVTVDAFGTLVELVDPVRPLRRALAERGVERAPDAVAAAFREEAGYYRARIGLRILPREDAVAALHRDCAAVFLAALRADLDPAEFAPGFLAALEFRLADGARAALTALRGAGLALACVSNWDPTLSRRLETLGVARFFAAVVTSAETGAAKPDPEIFRVALARLGVRPGRALHVGNEEADREGALAAGLLFEPAPLATLPERLGLGGGR